MCAYAAALLDSFRKIDTTSDILMHMNTPQPDEATVMSLPLASESAWFTGPLPSQIHPKEIRAVVLEQATAARAAIECRGLVDRLRCGEHPRRLLERLSWPRRPVCGSQAGLVYCRATGQVPLDLVGSSILKA